MTDGENLVYNIGGRDSPIVSRKLRRTQFILINSMKLHSSISDEELLTGLAQLGLEPKTASSYNTKDSGS